MALICEAPPPRPAALKFDSISELYGHFERIFLSGNGTIQSRCGHVITAFDHHFWHLAGVRDKFSMLAEKDELLKTTDGFGKYYLRENGSRGKRLLSARETFQEPDEVWEDNPESDAKWVYLKEYYDSGYQFSVAFVDIESEGSSILVPISSFSCDKNRLRKKWRKGKLIYPKTAQPPG